MNKPKYKVGDYILAVKDDVFHFNFYGKITGIIGDYYKIIQFNGDGETAISFERKTIIKIDEGWYKALYE